MKQKKILIIAANPVDTSFTHACADRYESVAKKTGASVKRFNINEMKFDPALHQGYAVIQDLEPDLVHFQEEVTRADHLVFIYPNWWSTMPAKMKGLFDRAFLPGFAFKFENAKCTPLLVNKSARIINVVGNDNPFLLRMKMGSFTNELANGILRVCGVRPVRVTSFGATQGATKEKLDRWLVRVEKMAEKDAV